MFLYNISLNINARGSIKKSFVLSNQNAVNYVNKLYNYSTKINMAKKLAEYAITKGSTDNVTVIILFLK